MQNLSSAVERCRLPARPRQLLGELQRLGETWFREALLKGLAAFERDLFQKASLATSTREQQGYFDAMRDIKAHREALWPAFRNEFDRQLGELPERALGHKPAAIAAAPLGRLSMLAASDMEESLTLSEISTRAEMRHSQALYQFGMRLGVLAGSPALGPDVNPFGPAALSHCLRSAAQALQLSQEHRVGFYRFLDRQTLATLDEYYGALNALLVSRQVLPNMDFVAPRRPPSGRPARPVRESAESESSEPESTSDVTEPERADPDPSLAPGLPAAAAAPDPGLKPSRPVAEQPHAARSSQAGGSSSAEEVFETLRELLTARRPPRQAQQGNLQEVPAEDIDAVLGLLQASRPAQTTVSGHPVPRTIAHLRQDLINHLRPLVPEGKVPNLPAEQSDALDLVGLLFDSVNRQSSGSALTQDLLNRMQAPIARLALKDHSFFSQRNHPARKLMNLLAETSMRWIDDPEADQALVGRLRSLVDQVSREFDGDPAVFEQGAADLEQQVGVMRRKAEVSERRHVDAARGRERLDLARQRSEAAIAGLIGERKPSRLLRTLLEQAWTDVLALTMLRSGDDAAPAERLLGIAKRLIDADRGEGSQLPHELKAEVERGLSSVGYHHADVDAISARLFEPERVESDDSIPTATELAVRLKARARLGQNPQGNAEGARRVNPPLNAAERQQFERLKRLPFGTWFEFRTNQQGDRVKRKLSWYSPLTLHCLFVNVRGVKALETDLEHLARDLQRDQVRVLDEEPTGLIDRAWATIMRTLRGLTQRDDLPEEA